MFYHNSTEEQSLKALGQRLEKWRLKRNETQASLAARIGISTMTYSKMIHGSSTVKVGYWVRALALLTSVDQLEALLKEETSFFAERDNKQSKPQKRVKRKKS